MKKILSYMTVLLLLVLAVSCNMDSDTGLFQEAGQSVKKESYVIRTVLAQDSSSSSYLVSSNEGIFVYSAKDGKTSDTVSIGSAYRNVIWGSLSSSSTSGSTAYTYTWECIYYSDPTNGGDGKYHIVKNDGTSEVYDSLSGDTYIVQSASFDNSGSTEKNVIVFRSSDNSQYYLFMKDSAVKPADSDVVSCSNPMYNVSYIGGNYFIGTEGESTSSGAYYFTFDGSTVGTPVSNDKKFRSYIGGCFVTTDKTFYIEGSDTAVDGTTSSSPVVRVPMTVVGDNAYFIISGVNEVYAVNKTENKLYKKSVSSLSGIEVIYVAGISTDGNYINVITAESGAKSINLKDSKVENWNTSF